MGGAGFDGGGGGYGGGGGGTAFGGGGGYSGGGGGSGEGVSTDTSGGGGGSYVDSTFFDTAETAGVNTDNGYVTITAVSTVPEPSTLRLACICALGLIVTAQRRRMRAPV
jgi:hypothetical protein